MINMQNNVCFGVPSTFFSLGCGVEVCHGQKGCRGGFPWKVRRQRQRLCTAPCHPASKTLLWDHQAQQLEDVGVCPLCLCAWGWDPWATANVEIKKGHPKKVFEVEAKKENGGTQQVQAKKAKPCTCNKKAPRKMSPVAKQPNNKTLQLGHHSLHQHITDCRAAGQQQQHIDSLCCFRGGRGFLL